MTKRSRLFDIPVGQMDRLTELMESIQAEPRPKIARIDAPLPPVAVDESHTPAGEFILDVFYDIRVRVREMFSEIDRVWLWRVCKMLSVEDPIIYPPMELLTEMEKGANRVLEIVRRARNEHPITLNANKALLSEKLTPWLAEQVLQRVPTLAQIKWDNCEHNHVGDDGCAERSKLGFYDVDFHRIKVIASKPRSVGDEWDGSFENVVAIVHEAVQTHHALEEQYLKDCWNTALEVNHNNAIRAVAAIWALAWSACRLSLPRSRNNPIHAIFGLPDDS